MATELSKIPSTRRASSTAGARNLFATAFFGGIDGPCLQLTMDSSDNFSRFTQFNKADVERLRDILNFWLETRFPNE